MPAVGLSSYQQRERKGSWELFWEAFGVLCHGYSSENPHAYNVCLVRGLFEGCVSAISMCFILLYQLACNNDEIALSYFFIQTHIAVKMSIHMNLMAYYNYFGIKVKWNKSLSLWSAFMLSKELFTLCLTPAYRRFKHCFLKTRLTPVIWKRC